jgi:hypothetical protein
MLTDPPSPPASQPDSWENRIQLAAQTLGLEPSRLESVLGALGLTKSMPDCLEVLADEEVFKLGPLQVVLKEVLACEPKDIPLRLAIKHLRGGKTKKEIAARAARSQQLTAALGARHSQPDTRNASTEDLLRLYDPKMAHDPVTVELRKRYGESPAIVFEPESERLDVEATIEYLTGLEQGLPPSEDGRIVVDGKLIELQAVGVVPDAMLEEDPLYPGRALAHGRSRANYAVWSEIPLVVRQFFRILLEQGQIDPEERKEVFGLLSDVRDALRKEGQTGQHAIDRLAEVYKESELEFRNRKKDGTLPLLQVKMSALGKGRRNDPFGVGRNRNY